MINAVRQRYKELFGFSKETDARNVHGFKRAKYRLDWLIWLMRRGCSANDYFIYKFWEKTSRERKQIITLLQGALIIRRLNGGGERKIVEDKRLFAERYGDMTKRLIMSSGELSSYEEFIAVLQKYGSLIVKPAFGFNGNDVHKVYASDSEADLRLEYEGIKSTECVIEEVLVQDGILRSLNPETLNTVRINVFNDHGELSVINAIVRSGQGDVVTDNICAGGVVAWVDVETGVVDSPFWDLNNQCIDRHPKSGVRLRGTALPSWGDAKLTALKAAERLGEGIAYSSWDIAILPQGEIAVVEGNTYGNFNIQQVVSGKGVWPVYKRLISRWQRNRGR